MTEQVKIKSTYLGASKLKEALAAAGPDGLRIVMFKPKKADAKEAFNGQIEVKRATDTEGAVIFGMQFFKTAENSDKPMIDKNGNPYMRLEVGNIGDKLLGVVFSNDKQGVEKRPDIRLVVNFDRETNVRGVMWTRVPDNGGDKYYSGVLGSTKPEAETEPTDGAAPATTETATTSSDPFGL